MREETAMVDAALDIPALEIPAGDHPEGQPATADGAGGQPRRAFADSTIRVDVDLLD